MMGRIKKFIKVLGLVIKSLYGCLRTLSKGRRTKFVPEREESVIVLGNGPSLNDIDLFKVKAEGIKIACVNFFPLKNKDFFDLKPQYLALFDPLFYTKHLGSDESALFEVLESVDWEMKIICTQEANFPIHNSKITYERVNGSLLYSEHLTKYIDWLYRKNLLTIGAQTVVIGAAFFFVNKLVNKIYLAGVDMSEFKMIFIDEDNRIYVDTVHNYGKERIYATVVSKGEVYKLMLMYQKMFEQFYFLEKFAKRQGVEIINLSVNSYIDVFPKKKLFWHTDL